ncbi:hypothetical protein BJ138DRAFT_1084683 [Hygrophoropsis aurantiaca]|uniref:Uncharacterized protein n=1 Tax=Hygrophoropsis aurantiaca TaxID=72124 RepID=A0ACB8AFB9_9AGAM|nr:hypothetical protein BJ138DRAFT_1084683 [Hygrophoropsis aurantiaca]
MKRTTHHCIFSLEEILSIIFCYCSLSTDPTESTAPDNNTLASLARTCRSFYEPAMDVLYSNVDMACLVQHMFEDLWYEDNMVLYFLRPMELRDWDEFFRYSRRVRILTTLSSFGINQNIYQALSHPPSHRINIFPRLNGLRLSNVIEYEFMSLLIKRNLTSILLSFGEGDEIATNILPSLPSTCPYLRRIKISPRLSGEDSIGTICEVLCNLPRLETLLFSGTVLPEKVLPHLACLPSLKELDITLPANSLDIIESDHNTFPALRELHLSSDKPEPCLQLLESVTSSCFEVIHLDASSMFSVEISQKIIILLSSFKNLSHITILERPSVAQSVDHGVFINILNPLLQLHNLQHLRLCSGSTYSVDDEVLNKMASAWPRLEFLDLWPPKRGKNVPRITLPGIIPLLRCCPKLYFFGSIIDATLPIADLSAYDTCNSSISLDVGASPISDPAAVAAFLSFVMPNIQSLSMLNPPSMHSILREHKPKWKRVKEIIGIDADALRPIANPLILALERNGHRWTTLD